MDVPRLLNDLRSDDWKVAVRAAELLCAVPGEQVTRALAEALNAHNTAITEAAAESLMVRDEPLTADLMWTALTSHDDDVIDQVWAVIESYPDHPVNKEIEQRHRDES